MNLTSPSQVRALLESLGLRPSKALGQNFLIDRNILEIILEASDLSADDHVLEIGPGLGVLTAELIRTVRRVTAVEKDRGLYEHLLTQFEGEPRVELIHADALEADLPGLLASGVTKVVSNLPYSVGSRLLVELAMTATPPAMMVVTVQQEVAARIAAPSGCSDQGLLGLWLQLVYGVERVKTISPTCFWPAPDIKSEIVRLTRHEVRRLDPAQQTVFRTVTRHAFQHRRKKLSTIFRQDPAVLSALSAVGIDPAARPESVPIGRWIELARTGRRDSTCV